MKKKQMIISRIVPAVVVIILTIILLCYFVFTIKNCSSYFEGQALSYSQKLTDRNASKIRVGVNSNVDKIKEISRRVSGVTGFEQLDALGENLVSEYNVSCLQFFFEGNANYRYGEGVGSATSKQMRAMIAGGDYAASDAFIDESLGVQCIAMYGPVEDNPEVDGVAVYFKTDDLFLADFSDDKLLQFYCLAEKDGSILDLYSADGFQTDVSRNIYTYLTNINRTKSAVESLEENAKNGIPGSYNISVGNEDYIISSATVSNISSNYSAFNIYRKADILHDQYPLYNQLFTTCIAVIIICVVIIILYFINNYNSILFINELDEVDPLIGCNTYNKFVRLTNELLSSNKHSEYAIVYLDINKFTFVRENFGSEMCDNILRQVSTIINSILGDNETYCHLVDDRFALLMRCSKLQEFTNRIKIIVALIANYKKAKEKNFTVSISVGVYQIERNMGYTVQEMIDRACVAQRIHKQENTEPFIMYDSNIRAAYTKEAEIESRMESALQNSEFKVFYQPKYNIAHDCIDGAEALVRWYDPKNNIYINPVDFVPLFEVNGFISKVDRFVFASVCEFLQKLRERGEKIVPLSVNVSRVTATKFDFLSYYINTKRTYNIPDGVLTLEFTESFAYDNYQTINNIVNELRKNGFKCSIDDFGSGYSSFAVLKELSMDELKLDKMFLNPSSDRLKDSVLLRSIIEIGNSFNMKVTQEGVESLEQLKQLEKYGCNVIQGYYYSKPLPTSDFIEFIGADTSLNSVISSYGSKLRPDSELLLSRS